MKHEYGMPETQKQWHRYLIKKSAMYIKHCGIEGSFVECGVKQGSSASIMAEVLNTNGYLFDTWCGFPHYNEVDAFDKVKQYSLEKRKHEKTDTFSACVHALTKNNVISQCKLIRGDICVTVPEFVSSNHICINMIHIDTDLYDPAKVSLELFYDMVVDGGVIFIHDYRDPSWPGITKAVNDFSIQKDVYVDSFNSNLYAAFIVKSKEKSKTQDYVKKFTSYIGDMSINV